MAATVVLEKRGFGGKDDGQDSRFLGLSTESRRWGSVGQMYLGLDAGLKGNKQGTHARNEVQMTAVTAVTAVTAKIRRRLLMLRRKDRKMSMIVHIIRQCAKTRTITAFGINVKQHRGD